MIIGLHGKAGSGKSTFAEAAVQNLGAVRLSFATALKKEVEEVLQDVGVPHLPEQLYGDAVAKEVPLVFVPRDMSKLQDSGAIGFGLLRTILVHRGMYSGGVCTITPRVLLQEWGNLKRKLEGPDYWINKLLLQCTDHSQLYIIDDVRYLNEAHLVKERLGGYLIKIVRPNTAAISGADHVSETELDTFEDWDVETLNCAAEDVFKMQASLIVLSLQNHFRDNLL